MKQPANDNGPVVGPVYTLEEVAERLRISRRKLQDFLRGKPHLYAISGRRKLFSAHDVTSIWETMRCHSALKCAPTPRTGSSVGKSEVSLFASLRAHTTRKLPRRFA